jgi:hypothetical protein
MAERWLWPAVAKGFVFGFAWWFILDWLFGEYLTKWPRVFLGALLALVTLFFWDTWRGQREDKQLRRFETGDQS